MLSDEEKKAIDKINNSYDYNTGWVEADASDWRIVTDLIEKQSKEIEHQIEKRANQRQELAILNAKQIEFNKLVNTVNSYKGQFKKQQKEIEELKEDRKKYAEEYIHNNPWLYKQLNEVYMLRTESKQKEKEAYNFGYRNGCNDTSKFNDKTFIRVDKIKAKIEELEKLNDEATGTGYGFAIYYLQSLLEKE